MQVFLRDLAPGQTYAIQFRSNDGKGDTSDWSQVQRFTTTNDTMPPADVGNLSVFTQQSSFIAHWDKVTTNSDGTPLSDFRYYHVHVSSLSGSGVGDFFVTNETFEFTKAMNIQIFGVFQTALTFSLTAVDLTYNESVHANVSTLDPTAPPVPSTPIVTSYLGLLAATWDGLDSTGAPAPNNTEYVEVHISATSGFTPTTSTLVGSIAIGQTRFVIPGMTYGTTYFIRFILVNLMNKRSGPSTQATGVPQRISGTLDINFTAKDIGGANAYYKTSQPTSADGNLKIGDIWYDTDDHYTTYRYDGTTWVLAPEVGIITGTKIISGTVTADAVGTNLLITSAANIQDAVISSAKISSVSAGSITAGTLSADVIISGRFATALTGARREMNGTGFQAFDASNALTVSIDGVNNLMTGAFQTGLSGRRVWVGGTTGLSIIEFFSAGSAAGTTATAVTGGQPWSYVWSFQDSGGFENIQMGNVYTGTNLTGIWNSVRVSSMQWNSYYSNRHTFMFGGLNSGSGTDSTKPGWFNIQMSSDLGATSINRFQIGSTELVYWDGAAVDRFQITATGMDLWYPTGLPGISLTSTYNILLRANGPFGGAPAIGGSAIQITGPSNAFQSSITLLATPPVGGAGGGVQYGGIYFWAMDSGIVNPRFEFKASDGSTWTPIWGGTYTNLSDARHKSNIRDLDLDPSEIVAKLRPRRFSKKMGTGIPDSDNEIGFIAQELPGEVLSTITTEDGDVYGLNESHLLAVLAASLKDALARIDALEKDK